jgi:hypothetical protein
MAVGAEVLDAAAQELEALEPEVRDGDILLCSARDPFSGLIGWATKSPWTHVGFAWRWHGVGRLMALECVQHIGVHAVPMERFISQTSSGTQPYPGKIVLARHAAMEAGADLQSIIHCGVDKMGDRFSPAEILKIAMRITLGRLARRTPAPLRSKDEFICSEYVSRCFEAGGVRIPWDGLGFIAPADVAADPQVRAIARIQTR